MAQRTCSVEGCERKHYGQSYCSKHWHRWYRHGDALISRIDRDPPLICRADACDRQPKAKGYCEMHWRRLKASGGVGGSRESRKAKVLRHGWLVHGNGGGINVHGYRVIVAPGHPNAYKNGTIQEHRFVMACHLERPLYVDEVVHHKNGIKTDNRIENLELRTQYHGKGQSVPDRIADAIFILERYAPELLA